MKEFVYQLTSEGENGCTYCGDGVAYVCRCPKHPTQIDELAQQFTRCERGWERAR